MVLRSGQVDHPCNAGKVARAVRSMSGTFEDIRAGLAAILCCMEPSQQRDQPYYRDDLALVHHLGFGFHADACASGILNLLKPVRARDGLVVEIGCGSGLLTAHLVDAGLRVIATDASDAMLHLARSTAPGAIEIRRVTLPSDPIPLADAIVGVGHALNYLDEESQVNEALVAIAESLRPGGLMAIDLCDLKWGAVRANEPPKVWRTKDWVLMTEFSLPEPNRFLRFMTTFVRNDDGSWRRDDERHDNVLIDTSKVPELLSRHGVNATTSESFGDTQLPEGLVAVIGRKTGRPNA
jgi:SAM-dependent methyltransferase